MIYVQSLMKILSVAKTIIPKKLDAIIQLEDIGYDQW